jgi:hypothetical protein
MHPGITISSRLRRVDAKSLERTRAVKGILLKKARQAPRRSGVLAREALAETLAGHAIACWQQVRACEIVLAEIGAWFDGDDPLKPVSREALNETHVRLSRVRDHIAALDKELELRDPPKAVPEVLRGIVRRFANRF